ncbi:MAG: hypothetical protein ACFFB3_20760, partial [Candidatus Hodarchaeota archaeon]
FVAEKINVDLGFYPHYYGPYSGQVASELQTLCAINVVEEHYQSFISQSELPFKKYSYHLTPDGNKLLEYLDQECPNEERETVQTVIDICRDVAQLNSEIISWAAKVHMILHRTDKPMTPEEIIATSRQFHWKMTDEDKIATAINLLDELKLIQVIREVPNV